MNKQNGYIPPPPPHLLKIDGASTASHRQNYTSLYSFDCEFRRCRNSLLFNTSGIRAAAEKSSTYHRYASALFSASSLYLHRLFAKALILFTAANNLYTAIENHLRSIKVRRRSLVCELAVSSISTYINSG